MKLYQIVILTLIALFLAACGNNAQQNNSNSQQGEDWHVGEFTATTQSGDEFNVTDLQGNWWVADFIFTNCTTVCLPMTSNMAKLQAMLEEEGLDNVKLVSFSVDPERDTPEVLTEYAEEYGADLNRWTFLTGYDFETIQNYSVGTFKSLLEPPPEGDDQVSHGTSFFLIDPNGNVVNYYSGTKADQMEDIVNDLKNYQ